MATAPVRAPWWLGPSGIALSLVLGALASGTVGYVLVEGWSVWDAFYMTVITVTTVGYREVHPLSRPGEVLTVLLLLGRVGTLLLRRCRCSSPGWSQAGFAERWEAKRRASHARRAPRPLHHLRLRPHGPDHRRRVPSPGRPASSSSIAIPTWCTS